MFPDRLSHDRTSAALDLGGGSTQITYEPHGSGSPSPVISLPGPHRNISLYTYRYWFDTIYCVFSANFDGCLL